MTKFHYQELDKKDWYRCNSCEGNGWVHFTGDAHKSSDMIPCVLCDDGIVKWRKVYENYNPQPVFAPDNHYDEEYIKEFLSHP